MQHVALGHRFKLWAEHEFGGVKQMFSVLDADSSGQLSFREFKARDTSPKGCRLALLATPRR